MMKARIIPSGIGGTIQAPASKSMMQRAVAAALLRGGRTILHHPGQSNDDKAALSIITALGAKLRWQNGPVVIESDGILSTGEVVDCGESGLSARMFTSIAALSGKQLLITGRGSLLARPMDFFDQVLPLLKVECETAGGRLPFRIRGPLVPADITIDGSLSSQYLTGLLLAYAGAGAKATITVNGLASRPYIDLTLQVMKAFGLPLPEEKGQSQYVFHGDTILPSGETFQYPIEGDWSGAALLLVAAAIAGKLEVRGLDIFSRQADKAILQVLQQAGAVMSVEPERVVVEKSRLRAFHCNATDCPDLFPPLVALACYAEGTSVIEGAGRLVHKESNRAETLIEEFTSLGVDIKLQGDMMVVHGGRLQPTRSLHAHHDHRIAMALAVAALGMQAPVEIHGAQAVDKSYPQFWDHLADAGALLSLEEI